MYHLGISSVKNSGKACDFVDSINAYALRWRSQLDQVLNGYGPISARTNHCYPFLNVYLGDFGAPMRPVPQYNLAGGIRLYGRPVDDVNEASVGAQNQEILRIHPAVLGFGLMLGNASGAGSDFVIDVAVCGMVFAERGGGFAG